MDSRCSFKFIIFNMRIMLKYISIVLLLIFTSTFCGCNLDTDDEDKMPGDKFWDGSAANAEAFMLSVYQNLRKATTDNGFSFMPVISVVHLLRDRARRLSVFVAE